MDDLDGQFRDITNNIGRIGGRWNRLRMASRKSYVTVHSFIWSEIIIAVLAFIIGIVFTLEITR
jgi:hypothetical protein